MPISLFLSSALGTACWALWMRRTAFGCRWETAPTMVVATAAMAAFLTSGWGSAILGRSLYALTGQWHFEDLLGHLCAIVSASSAVYMFMVRFAGGETLQRLYTQWVVRPLTVVIPLLVTCHTLARAGQEYSRNFDDVEPGPWLGLYWLVLCGTLVYLSGYAARLVLLLRQSDRRCSGTVLNMYLAASVATILFVVLLYVHVITPYNIRGIARPLGYLAVMMWSITPAYSWKLKSTPARRRQHLRRREDVGR